MKLQCLKLFIMTKTKKNNFWRISVKFHLWVPLNPLWRLFFKDSGEEMCLANMFNGG